MPDAIPGKLIAPEPAPPVRQYSFTDWQVNNPTAPPPGDRLDAEFDRGNSTQSQTLDWVGTSLNTDGTLRPGIVGEPQFVPGLFDHITDDAVAQVQPLVDQAGSYATQALSSANAALSYSSLASGSSTSAGQAATDAQTSASTAQGAATGARGSADTAAARAADAANSANHADGSEAQSQAYADVSTAWAEHMPDTIPPNILAVQGVTGDHWSSRWWANRAAETLSDLEDLLAKAPPQAIVFYNTYIATAGQTVFTGPDRDGKLLTYTPGPTQTLLVYANGLLRTPVNDYTGTTNTVTFTQPRAAGDIVQIQVEGVATQAGQYLPLAGGTMTGAIVLAADPAGPLQPVTRQYSDGKYVPFTGGTFTGPVVLAADPTAALGAATKRYADAKLALAGGTLTGPLVLAADPVTALGATTKQYADAKLALSGGTLTGPLVLAANPVAVLGAATKQYADGKLALTGGTLTGPLVLAADPTAALGTATKQYVDNHAPLGGPYLPLSGGALTGPLAINAAAGSWATLNLSRAAGQGAQIAGYTGLNVRWTLALGDATAESGGNAGSNFSIGRFDDAGNYLGAVLSINRATGDVTVGGTLTGANLIGNFTRGTTSVSVGDGTQQMFQPSGYRSYAFSNNWQFNWSTANGTLIWNADTAGPFIQFDFPGTHGINWLGPWQGNGSYIPTSDERMKTDITSASVGLPEALAINPIRFRRLDYDGTEHDRYEIGFSAQQLQGVIPEAVLPVGTPDGEGPGSLNSEAPILGINVEPIVAALVNAVKELSARLSALEGVSP
jgi:hypothetical protein